MKLIVCIYKWNLSTVVAAIERQPCISLVWPLLLHGPVADPMQNNLDKINTYLHLQHNTGQTIFYCTHIIVTYIFIYTDAEVLCSNCRNNMLIYMQIMHTVPPMQVTMMKIEIVLRVYNSLKCTGTSGYVQEM